MFINYTYRKWEIGKTTSMMNKADVWMRDLSSGRRKERSPCR